MAAGDTISGQIRIMREKTLGDRSCVAGPFGSIEVDHKGDPENSLYMNPDPKSRFLPLGSRSVRAKRAVFEAGEILDIQHLSASLAEAADYDADEIFVGCLQTDLNTGEVKPRTLTVVDTTLEANPTTSTTVWTSIFKYTVPDRRRVAIAGPVNLAAVEAA